MRLIKNATIQINGTLSIAHSYRIKHIISYAIEFSHITLNRHFNIYLFYTLHNIDGIENARQQPLIRNGKIDNLFF